MKRMRRGWLLLECVVALALLVVLVIAVQGALGSAAAGVRSAERSSACEDLARSLLAAMELGLTTPEAVHGERVDWPAEAPWPDPGASRGAFDESAPAGAFEIAVETEPMGGGLVLVRVEVRTTDDPGGRARLAQVLPAVGALLAEGRP